MTSRGVYCWQSGILAIGKCGIQLLFTMVHCYTRTLSFVCKCLKRFLITTLPLSFHYFIISRDENNRYNCKMVLNRLN